MIFVVAMVWHDLGLMSQLSKLTHRNDGWEALVRVIPGGVIRVSSETETITFCNPAIARRLGYEQFELLGQPATVLLPEKYRARHHKYWTHEEAKRRRSDSAVVIAPCAMMTKTGQKIPATLWVSGIDTEPYEWLVFVPPPGAALINGITVIEPKELEMILEDMQSLELGDE